MKPRLTNPTDFQEVATEIFDELHQKYKKQKHEEIRKIALRMYTQAAWPDYEKRETCFPNLEDIWKLAEEFYNFAKEKENSNNENKCAHCGKLFEEQQICYSLDTKGNKFCSKKCVLENLEQEEADGDK